MNQTFAYYDSPLGRILLGEVDGELNCLCFEGQKNYPILPSEPQFVGGSAVNSVIKWLDAYFERKPISIDFPLHLEGTSFQKMVWTALMDIPYGHTTSYGDLAVTLTLQSGQRVAPIAVGHAVALNPISLIIPCHRVIGKDGSMVGYAGGIERKQALLELERN